MEWTPKAPVSVSRGRQPGSQAGEARRPPAARPCDGAARSRPSLGNGTPPLRAPGEPMPPCAQVRLPACGRDVRAEQSPQHHDKGGMTDPNAVCRAPARTAARLVARLFCTRPDPVARARSLPFNACVSRRKGRRRPVFNLTSVPKRPESSSTASRRALRPPHSRPRSLDTHPHAHDVCACVRPAALMTSRSRAQTWRQCYLVFLLVCLVSFHSLFLLSLLSLLSIFPPLFSSP